LLGRAVGLSSEFVSYEIHYGQFLKKPDVNVRKTVSVLKHHKVKMHERKEAESHSMFISFTNRLLSAWEQSSNTHKRGRSVESSAGEEKRHFLCCA
jgi:hypothetical protein